MLSSLAQLLSLMECEAQVRSCTELVYWYPAVWCRRSNVLGCSLLKLPLRRTVSVALGHPQFIWVRCHVCLPIHCPSVLWAGRLPFVEWFAQAIVIESGGSLLQSDIRVNSMLVMSRTARMLPAVPSIHMQKQPFL